jgi:hypothetical protein
MSKSLDAAEALVVLAVRRVGGRKYSTILSL